MREHSEVFLFDYEAAAKALSLTRPALRDLVYRGRGPRVTKIGRRTFFAKRDLLAFIEAHREPLVEISPLPANTRPKRGRPTLLEKIARS